MNSRGRARHLLAAHLVGVLVGVLVGGGLMAVTPAGAEVAQVATNWTKIWKKKLQPQADRRYYKKSTSDSRYASRSALATFWTKADADARYQPKGSYALAGSSYTRAESDGRFAPFPTTLRGTWSMMTTANDLGTYVSTEIEFGQTLSAAPTVHFIAPGAVPPPGCSGTPAAPEASAGNLCVFAFGYYGLNPIAIKDATNMGGKASPFGAILFATTSSTVTSYAYGAWAVRPLALAPAAASLAGAGTGAASADPAE